jgi:IclR family transcriptional regulator, KDG regulon repressor
VLKIAGEDETMSVATGSSGFPSQVQGVPAVERALKLLELTATSDTALTLSEVGKALGIPKSSAHRLVYTLLAHGYLQRTPNARSYILGTCARDLANSITDADLQLGTVCSHFAEELSRKTGLTVLAGIRRGIEGVVILKADSPDDEYPGAFIGHHFELHCTALGKALVAYLAEPEVDEIFQQSSLLRYTEATVTSRKNLLAGLAEVRAKGFALNTEEASIGGRGLAAPIFNHIGRVVASICVRGSTDLFPAWRIPSCSKEVMSVATQISRHLLEAMP